MSLEIFKWNIGKKIYFLNTKGISDGKDHKLNLNNCVILINDKIYDSKAYFVPKTEGIYTIKIFINHLVEDCFSIFDVLINHTFY